MSEFISIPYTPPQPEEGPISVEIDPDLADLIPMFLDNRKEEVEELRRALEEGDSETISEIGHRMKGIGGGYGFPYVSTAGRALEDLAEAGALEGAGEWIEGLADYLERVEVP